MKINKKLIIIISAVVISIAAGSVVWQVSRRQNKPADFAGQKREQIEQYLRSDEFRDLDPNTRRAYARQAFRQMMTQRAEEYCELSPQDRTAYLDNIIDTMRTRRRGWGFRPPRDGQQGQRPPRPRRRPEDMRARSESIDPASRAQMGAFRQALRERMRERGINPPRRRPPR